MATLTLSMIVKNEEKYLEECLQSVKGIADEIVIVDTGSSDNTKRIAQNFNAKIYNFNWNNDFAAARNFALKNSTGKWILYLDADERLNKNSAEELKRVIQSESREAVYCTVNSIDDYTHRPNLMRYTRLFSNNDKIHFEGKVHEQIEGSLKENGYSFINSSIEIIHLGYNIPPELKKEKAKRNLKILLDDYHENPSSYNAYQLAQTYNIIDEKDKASEYFEMCIKDENLPDSYKAISYLFISNQYFKKYNLSEAYSSIKNALKFGKKQPSVNLLAGKISYKLNRIDEALDYVKNALFYNKSLNNGFEVFIQLDDREIIYNGLFMSLSLQDCEFFNSFRKELFLLWSKTEKENYDIYTDVFNKLLGKRALGTVDINTLTGMIDDISMETYLAIIRRYQPEIKKKIAAELYKRFSYDISFVNLYADVLMETYDINKAIEVLEAGLHLSEKEPSTYFYLISLYIKKNNFEKVEELVEKAVSEFSHIEEVKSKLDILIDKLSSAIKTSH